MNGSKIRIRSPLPRLDLPNDRPKANWKFGIFFFVFEDESSDEETIEEKIQVPLNSGQINSAIKPVNANKQKAVFFYSFRN
jgi:hypothetical protein